MHRRGTMDTTRFLIVNADDFGQSAGVNRGIIAAHQVGILTSASLMVRWPAAVEAAAYAREHPRFSLGLHFDFGEWAYRRGSWVKLYDVVPENDVEQVTKEAGRQLATFHRLVGRAPTHIDTHQHIHLRKSLRPIFLAIAEELGVPLRSCNSRIRYCGSFYGQDDEGRSIPSFIGVPALIRLIAKLPVGFTELGCHPGHAEDLNSMYRKERAVEVRTLRDPRVRTAIDRQGINLCSFHDISERIVASEAAADSLTPSR